MRMDQAFAPVSHDMWSIAFPAGDLRRRNLFQQYDTYGHGITRLKSRIVMSALEVDANSFTQAMLDFHTNGLWLVKGKYLRYSDRELCFLFEDADDAAMMKFFGIRGTMVPG